MIKAIVSDFSRVILFPKDKNYLDSLNALHKQLSETDGYNPLDYFELNNDLLELYATLKNKHDLYIFTSDSIQDAPEFQPFLQPIFSQVLSAKKLNTDKKQTRAYELISKLLHLSPEQILYIDDAQENVNAARAAGMNTILYQNVVQLQSELGDILA